MKIQSIFTSKIRRIVSLLRDAGATDVLAVGGSVRDALLGHKSKDIDLEVYGLDYATIARVLGDSFPVSLVGRSFGVLKVGSAIDVALPRRESKAGIGHRGFEIDSNPTLTPQEAFARRDFTINAIGMRPDGTLVDYYGGQKDLADQILRATSDAFRDDPLRVLRGMQFASRFGLTMEEKTIDLCRQIFSEFSTLSEERIYDEWQKWAVMGKCPALGLDILFQTGWVNAFPELAALVGCPQNPNWHPEGDVWTHTKLVCEEMARLLQANGQDLLFSDSASDEAVEEEAVPPQPPDPFTDEERTILMFAALGHDFGKPETTTRDENGVIRSHGHADASVPLIEAFLTRMKAPTRIVERTIPLVREHMVITRTNRQLGEPTSKTVRRLACRLEPANIRLWAALCRSDALGCFPAARQKRLIRFQARDWLDAASRANVQQEKPKAILLGRHLLSLGITPGPLMGKILETAYQGQIDGEFDSPETAITWLESRGNLPRRT